MRLALYNHKESIAYFSSGVNRIWLRAVTFLRTGGMSIAQIKHYFALCQQGDAALPERKAILEQARDAAQKDLEEAAMRLHCLNEKIGICQQAIEGKREDDCNPLNW